MSRLSSQEVVSRGTDLYDRQVRPRLDEAAHRGQYLVLDIETGEYEVDADHLSASDRAHAKHPGAALFAMRIGYPTLGRLGGRARAV